ncbi:ISL3 family transposase [Nonomuraea basaltis]|uniref:ISL3 family transposase n=1 Tax=Nonomuraea basaltis TaxID=2495887 RepID=UPI00110C615C|nr:ISL3 family transposase [Nonomuraea basaltis]TMR89304.1 ISL3 family transposase [Nonomuraea basaltis]
MVNDTTLLLGLDGLDVTKVVAAGDGVQDGPVVHLATADERARYCPQCGVAAVRVKEWVTTRPRDLPIAGRRCALRWRKRRWRCNQASCPRQTFTEQVPQIPARSRLTVRLRQASGAAVGDGGRTVIQSARDHGLSWPIVSAAFTQHAHRVLPDQPEPVTVLGIDEVRRGRPRWVLDETTGTWKTAVDRWHVGFVDLSGDQGLLGQVEGRTITAVTSWLDLRPPSWRAQVAFVAIDMCSIFKSAVRAALPHATLVVDHFHVVQLANTALIEIRRRITVQIRGRRGRKGNREWELRNRLTRSAARMHARQLDPMVDDLHALGRIGTPILAAWNAKEDLLDLLALARTHPDRTVIAERLFRFYDRCAASGLPELHRLATTIETWWPEILAFLQTGITNAGSEGTNRVIKTVARDAYGFRNPDNQRLRTRCATTRKGRGCLNPA